MLLSGINAAETATRHKIDVAALGYETGPAIAVLCSEPEPERSTKLMLTANGARDLAKGLIDAANAADEHLRPCDRCGDPLLDEDRASVHSLDGEPETIHKRCLRLA